jgi:hypothetical protein
MPHLVFSGRLDLSAASLDPKVHRWGRAVLKTDACWLRADEAAMLVEGVVVEFSRPLHPVAVAAHHHGETTLRLWKTVAVERTRPVQRWLCLVALELQRCGAGPVRMTNIPSELWRDLELQVVPELRSDPE